MRQTFKKLLTHTRAEHTETVSSLLRKGSSDVTTRIARYLSRKEQGLSLRTKKLLLAYFCFCVCGYAGILLYQGVAGSPPFTGNYLHLEEITRPTLGRLPDSLSLELIRRQAAKTDSSFSHP